MDDRAAAASHLRIIVPVRTTLIEGDITIRHIQIHRSVIIQVSELSAETPSTQFNAEASGQILKLWQGGICGYRHPQIVALNQNSILRNVADIKGKSPFIEDITDRRIHATFRGGTDPAFLADFTKTSTVIDEQFRDTIIIRDEQIGTAGTAEVDCCRSQGPALVLKTDFFSDLFEPP